MSARPDWVNHVRMSGTMPGRSMRTLVWLFAAASLLACSKDHHPQGGAGADNDDESVTAEDFSSRLGKALNQHHERCCKQAGLDHPDPIGLGGGLPSQAVSAEFDAHAAATCLRQTRNAPCERAKESASSPKVCRQVFTRGTIKRGQACRSSWDCAPSDEPDAFPYCDTTCKLWYTLPEGADCSPRENATVVCASPLLCSDDEVCVRPAKLGESCLTGPQWGDTCAEGSVCDRNGTKRCVKPTPVGKPCTELEDCEWLACIDGLCRDPLSVVTICEPQ